MSRQVSERIYQARQRWLREHPSTELGQRWLREQSSKESLDFTAEKADTKGMTRASITTGIKGSYGSDRTPSTETIRLALEVTSGPADTLSRQVWLSMHYREAEQVIDSLALWLSTPDSGPTPVNSRNLRAAYLRKLADAIEASSDDDVYASFAFAHRHGSEWHYHEDDSVGHQHDDGPGMALPGS